jgi:hypothetical protein
MPRHKEVALALENLVKKRRSELNDLAQEKILERVEELRSTAEMHAFRHQALYGSRLQAFLLAASSRQVQAYILKTTMNKISAFLGSERKAN